MTGTKQSTPLSGGSGACSARSGRSQLPYCLPWGQGRARELALEPEPRILMRSRGGGERATPRVANARPRGVRGGGGPGGNLGSSGCKSPSCGCYWQPSLC